MSARISGSGQILRRTTDLPDDNSFTLAGWMRFVTTPTTYAFFGIENAVTDSTAWKVMGRGDYTYSGRWFVSSNGGDGVASTSAVNTPNSSTGWFYCALKCSSTTIQAHWITSDGTTTYTTESSGHGGDMAAAVLSIGNDSWDEWMDGRFAYFRVWNVVLTQAEIEAEQFSPTPVRTSDLYAHWPLLENGNDVSGNDRHLSVVGSVTWESDAPPVNAGAPTRTGSGSASLPAYTAAGTGDHSVPEATTHTGSGSVSLPAYTASGTGDHLALVLTQSAYRFYADDGAENAATPLAAQNIGAFLGVGTRVRIRIQLDAVGGDPPAAAYRLDYRKSADNGDTWSDWTPIEVSAPVYSGMLLSVSSLNARYVVDESNDPVLLTGFHTWGNIQDTDTSSPPDAFDWTEYLTALTSRGLNFTKLWTLESPRGWGIYRSPSRYARTGPGNAADGALKFDLTQINNDWLDRLEARALACRNAGIWVCVQLFQGWDIELKSGDFENSWPYHPYRAENNINSIDGDVNDDGQGTEIQLYSGNPALSLQETLVEAVIDRLNYLDNIFYEISNEPTGSAGNTAWQNHLINYIRAYEATKPKQHLVLMTVQYPNGNNTVLDESGAELVSYSHRNVVSGTKVSMSDTDHIEGIATGYTWVWESLCNGHGGLWYMDRWDSSLYSGDTRNDSTFVLIRDNLGYAMTLINLIINLEAMTPQSSLCSTGYCLARNHATAAEYICANVNGLSSFTLNLSAATGTLNVRWLNCATGATSTTTVAGGATRTLTPPWAGVNVAYVRHGAF